MKNWNFLLLGTALLFTFASCKKDSTFTTDNSISEDAFQDVYKNVNNVGEGNESDLRNGCAVVTHTSDTIGTFPDTVTVDFGTTGCTGTDGRIRKGKIIMVFTGRWRTVNTTVTATLDGYSVNGYQIAGTKTITNAGPNSSGNIVFTTVVTNGSVTNPAGETATWSCNKSTEWIAGYGTTFATTGVSGVTDDVFSITGTASGTSHGGTAFTATITEPLIRRMDCRWIVDGVMEITPSGKPTRTIDFGGGTCDDEATVTFRNRTTTIHLIH